MAAASSNSLVRSLDRSCVGGGSRLGGQQKPKTPNEEKKEREKSFFLCRQPARQDRRTQQTTFFPCSVIFQRAKNWRSIFFYSSRLDHLKIVENNFRYVLGVGMCVCVYKSMFRVCGYCICTRINATM